MFTSDYRKRKFEYGLLVSDHIADYSNLNHEASTHRRKCQTNPERETLWESDFFKSFPLVFLAAKSSLSPQKVEQFFKEKNTSDLSKSYQKLIFIQGNLIMGFQIHFLTTSSWIKQENTLIEFHK